METLFFLSLPLPHFLFLFKDKTFLIVHLFFQWNVKSVKGLQWGKPVILKCI